MDKVSHLKSILAEVDDINRATSVLSWDQRTHMPPGGAEERSNQRATLSRLSHMKFTSEEVGCLLADLSPWADSLDPDSDDARLIKVTLREYHKATRVPPKWVAEFARVAAASEATWEMAKATSNFNQFRPHLERVIEMRREYSSFFAPYEHVYDPLLDDFEPGLKTAEVQAIFGVLRPQQVALIQQIAACPQVENGFLSLSFPEQAQWNFGVEVITRFGYDWKRGRQDKTTHPFTTSFGHGDVRITTRFMPGYLPSALFGSMHECGHALYDLGLSASLRRSPLSTGASMAIHESQSRMWENLVGRSYPFWEFFYPRLQAVFPTQLGGISLHKFYRGINQVKPSLIRVEADEATYNLHIMLRLELEIALMEGSLSAADLPDAWNSLMQEYLGITPPDHAHGVMQDIHWSGGSFGYFPTYALGNLVSVQLWEVINRDLSDLPEQIRRGEFSNLLAWLREKIHQHGAKFEPQELVQKITGSKIDPRPYLRYLKAKYSEIYSL